MTAHSLLGASSAYRWLACPGSFKLSQSAPHRPSSIYAATGTLAHLYIAEAVQRGEPFVDPALLGQTIICDGHSIHVDQDLVDGINVMLKYLSDVSAGHDWMDVEFRVDLDSYFPTSPPAPVFGTVDAGVLHFGILEVIDYKNGAGITVSPTENPQLMFYAAGALAQLPSELRILVRKIKLTIVQPHASGVAPIRVWLLDPIDLLMWVDEVLVPGVETCAQPDAPLNPGSWCRFCPVSHACPKLMADALEMAKREFDDEALVSIMPTEPDELSRALDTAEWAELWITRIREFAVDQLQHQVRIPGWGLVPTRPTRKWLAPDADIARGLVDLGADIEEVWEERVRSPAQLEKILHRTRKGRGIWDRAQNLIEARSTGTKLGRDNHANAREDFEDDR